MFIFWIIIIIMFSLFNMYFIDFNIDHMFFCRALLNIIKLVFAIFKVNLLAL